MAGVIAAQAFGSRTSEAQIKGIRGYVGGQEVCARPIAHIDGLLSGTKHPEHPDCEPDLNFKTAKAESDSQQQALI